MIGQSIFHLITVIFMAVTGDPDVNPGELLAMLMNAIAMGLAVMLLLALVSCNFWESSLIHGLG